MIVLPNWVVKAANIGTWIVVGIGVGRFVPEIFKEPVAGQKTWQELYGPMISSTLVATAGYLGIRYTASRSAKQKQLELRVEQSTKRIDALAVLVGALYTYSYTNYNIIKTKKMLRLAEQFAGGEMDETHSRRFDENLDAFSERQKASAELARIAHTFGSLPYDTDFPIHLGEVTQGWVVFTLDIMKDTSLDDPTKLTVIYKSRDYLASYIRSVIDILAIKRASMMEESHIDYAAVDPPYFNKNSYPAAWTITSTTEQD